jgi:hypothetical protein
MTKFMGGSKSSQSAASDTTAVAASGAVPAPSPVAPGSLPNTDRVVVQRDSNQLISFGLFKSKDPFVQQLSATPAPSETGPAATTPTTPAPTPIPAPGVPAGSPVVPGSGTGSTGSSGETPTGPTTTPGSTTPETAPSAASEALIATNGVCERLSVKSTFPSGQNIFRLVSIAKNGKSVEIGVVGGSFDSGKPTATLKLGDKLTLVNTADGTRYEIVLKTSCNLPPETGTTTTSAATTPVAPTPTTTPATTDTTPATTTTTATATTPIVTDSLDTTPTTTTTPSS